MAKAIESPFSLALLGLAWYSMDGSLRELRQIAHVSAQISHDHMVTAFHSTIVMSKRGEERGRRVRVDWSWKMMKVSKVNGGLDATSYMVNFT